MLFKTLPLLLLASRAYAMFTMDLDDFNALGNPHLGNPFVDQETSTKLVAFINWQHYLDEWAKTLTAGSVDNYVSNLHMCWFKWETTQWA